MNGRNSQGLTAVMAVTHSGKMPLLEILLNAGADPDRTDRAGRTALYIAIGYGRIDATRLLLVNGADTARIHTSGSGASAYAASPGRRTQAGMFMAAGADALTEGPGEAPIHFAAARQDRTLIEWLLARGEDIGRPAAATGMTPPMHAAKFGSPGGRRACARLSPGCQLAGQGGMDGVDARGASGSCGKRGRVARVGCRLKYRGGRRGNGVSAGGAARACRLAAAVGGRGRESGPDPSSGVGAERGDGGATFRVGDGGAGAARERGRAISVAERDGGCAEESDGGAGRRRRRSTGAALG